MTDYLITPEEARKAKINLPDGYDAFTINYGQLCQLIEETAPYTDFLVIKYPIKWKWLKRLKKKGYFVNSMKERITQQEFTFISWKKMVTDEA